MTEKELEGAKKLIENKDVKKGSYSFIGDSNITYADIKILLDYIKQLEQEYQKYKEVIDKAIKYINYNNRYRNGADIYQFVDIKGEILEPLKDILEQNEENSNIYLKEFNDWLKEVE